MPHAPCTIIFYMLNQLFAYVSLPLYIKSVQEDMKYTYITTIILDYS